MILCAIEFSPRRDDIRRRNTGISPHLCPPQAETPLDANSTGTYRASGTTKGGPVCPPDSDAVSLRESDPRQRCLLCWSLIFLSGVALGLGSISPSLCQRLRRISAECLLPGCRDVFALERKFSRQYEWPLFIECQVMQA